MSVATEITARHAQACIEMRADVLHARDEVLKTLSNGGVGRDPEGWAMMDTLLAVATELTDLNELVESGTLTGWDLLRLIQKLRHLRHGLALAFDGGRYWAAGAYFHVQKPCPVGGKW